MPKPDALVTSPRRLNLDDFLAVVLALARGGALPVTALTQHTASRVAAFCRDLEAQAKLPGLLEAVRESGAPGLLRAMTAAGYGDVVLELEKGQEEQAPT